MLISRVLGSVRWSIFCLITGGKAPGRKGLPLVAFHWKYYPKPIALPVCRLFIPMDISVGDMGASMRRSFWAWVG